jgi:glycosyltransferase involved in cell wall biosynthesis
VPLFAEWAGQVARDVVQSDMENCAHAIVPTESIKSMIHSDYEVDVPVSVLSTPIDLERFSNLDPVPLRQRHHLEGREVLMYLGRISPKEDLDVMLRVFARVSAQHQQATLVFVGRGPHTEALQDLAYELDLQDRVVFAGAVPYADVPGTLTVADLFVFPSRCEIQGLVLIEAMAAGTPVVAVHTKGTDDALAIRQGGRLVGHHEEAFADAILLALSSPKRLAAMRRVAQDSPLVLSGERNG